MPAVIVSRMGIHLRMSAPMRVMVTTRTPVAEELVNHSSIRIESTTCGDAVCAYRNIEVCKCSSIPS